MINVQKKLGSNGIQNINKEIVYLFDEAGFVEALPFTVYEIKYAGSSRLLNNTGLVDAALNEADIAQNIKPRSGAAGAFEVNGEIFTAQSVKGNVPPMLHPQVQTELDAIPDSLQSKSHGRCVEPQCLSQALYAGINPQGGSSLVVNVRPQGNLRHQEPLTACPTCRVLLGKYGITDVASNP